jgi:hypothetical protein
MDNLTIIEKELKRQIEITVAYCDTNSEFSHWNKNFFKPALQALCDKKINSSSERIASACNHLQVFGGMGSWSDVGGRSPNRDKLFEIYTKANNLR